MEQWWTLRGIKGYSWGILENKSYSKIQNHKSNVPHNTLGAKRIKRLGRESVMGRSP